MEAKKLSQVLLLILAIILILLIYNIYIKKNHNEKVEKILTKETKEKNSNNVINDLEYSSIDVKGNKYIILSKEGMIDPVDANIIYMTGVDAKIIMPEDETIYISSNFAKYDQTTNDTNFREEVLLLSGIHTINTEILNFSFGNSLVNMSNKVIYKSMDTILIGDRLEFDLITKKTKIFMNSESKKVKIKTIK
ncbi:LPS export ABC transporter periplasmic protein LptC [Candidatus Pelagibacter sp.]|nr:LPS export ABC transporter periplasmic protein LptC [Candidatus Pelagibacter sp.]